GAPDASRETDDRLQPEEKQTSGQPESQPLQSRDEATGLRRRLVYAENDDELTDSLDEVDSALSQLEDISGMGETSRVPPPRRATIRALLEGVVKSAADAASDIGRKRADRGDVGGEEPTSTARAHSSDAPPGSLSADGDVKPAIRAELKDEELYLRKEKMDGTEYPEGQARSAIETVPNVVPAEPHRHHKACEEAVLVISSAAQHQPPKPIQPPGPPSVFDTLLQKVTLRLTAAKGAHQEFTASKIIQSEQEVNKGAQEKDEVAGGVQSDEGVDAVVHKEDEEDVQLASSASEKSVNTSSVAVVAGCRTELGEGDIPEVAIRVPYRRDVPLIEAELGSRHPATERFRKKRPPSRSPSPKKHGRTSAAHAVASAGGSKAATAGTAARRVPGRKGLKKQSAFERAAQHAASAGPGAASRMAKTAAASSKSKRASATDRKMGSTSATGRVAATRATTGRAGSPPGTPTKESVLRKFNQRLRTLSATSLSASGSITPERSLHLETDPVPYRDNPPPVSREPVFLREMERQRAEAAGASSAHPSQPVKPSPAEDDVVAGAGGGRAKAAAWAESTLKSGPEILERANAKLLDDLRLRDEEIRELRQELERGFEMTARPRSRENEEMRAALDRCRRDLVVRDQEIGALRADLERVRPQQEKAGYGTLREKFLRASADGGAKQQRLPDLETAQLRREIEEQEALIRGYQTENERLTIWARAAKDQAGEAERAASLQVQAAMREVAALQSQVDELRAGSTRQANAMALEANVRLTAELARATAEIESAQKLRAQEVEDAVSAARKDLEADLEKERARTRAAREELLKSEEAKMALEEVGIRLRMEVVKLKAELDAERRAAAAAATEKPDTTLVSDGVACP
ncbi:MAG: hypothetical protein BJ554DRAFT_7711, partial [Olpidium bornovanus]